jgi:hypothetical protein
VIDLHIVQEVQELGALRPSGSGGGDAENTADSKRQKEDTGRPAKTAKKEEGAQGGAVARPCHPGTSVIVIYLEKKVMAEC